MKYLSVCSGIEAASVAWRGLGWAPVAFSEIEPFPSAVLAHHYPDVPNLGDMTKYRDWPDEILAEVDLLVGGTPCQAFSTAGARKSLEDERGNLTLVFVNLNRHINEVRRRHGRPPVIVVWENVPGVLSTKDNAFGCLVGGLLGLDEAPETENGKWDRAGFLCSETARVGYRVLDAQYFGVAQRRRRVFLVAVPSEVVTSSGERACPSEILSLRENVSGDPPEVRPQGEVAAADAGGGPAARSVGVMAFAKSRRAQSVHDHETWVEGDVAPTVNQFDVGEVRSTTLAIGFNWQNGGGYGAANDGLGITAEGTAPLSRSQVPAVATTWWNGDDVSQTLDAVLSKGQAMPEKNRFPCVMTGPQVRRITPREAALLQGFPPDYLDVAYRKSPAADGPKYRAIGNSMAVPCMRWVGQRISDRLLEDSHALRNQTA